MIPFYYSKAKLFLYCICYIDSPPISAQGESGWLTKLKAVNHKNICSNKSLVMVKRWGGREQGVQGVK